MRVLLIQAGESHKLKGDGRFSRNGNCLKLIRRNFDKTANPTRNLLSDKESPVGARDTKSTSLISQVLRKAMNCSLGSCGFRATLL
jgi:hypothetical protein